MPLSLKQLQDVCMIYNQSNQCRYLRQDVQNYNNWYCVKLKQAEKDKVDIKVQKMLAEAKQNGLKPDQSGVAYSDNCAGYPLLKHIEQGYDKP